MCQGHSNEATSLRRRSSPDPPGFDGARLTLRSQPAHDLLDNSGNTDLAT